MRDALAFSIDIDGNAYASTNRITRGAGDLRKSAVYKAVRKAVAYAATTEMLRTGWTKAECDCIVIVTRIMPNGKAFDAGNMGKPEMDGLTDAGVWDDDVRANPPMYFVRVDPNGQHRVAVVVQKLYEPRETFVTKPRRSVAEERAVQGLEPIQPRTRYRDPMVAGWKPGMPAPDGYAVENGRRLVKIDAQLLDRIR